MMKRTEESQRGGRPCMQCGATMAGKRENYRYDASGLSRVTLANVMVYRCPQCGEHEVQIPNILGLHKAMALALVAKRERLAPEEIRFLRTFLGYSSADLARKLGVTPQTVSRWERTDAPLRMKPAVDRLLRLMVLAGDVVKGYPLEEVATEEPKESSFRATVSDSEWHTKAA